MTEQKSTLVAVDLGYGFIDARTATQYVRFPSAIGISEEIKYGGNLVDSGRNNRSPDDIRLEMDSGRYFVGEMALRQSSTYHSLQDRSRIGTEDDLILLHAALARLGVSGPIRLVVGLPVEWYGDRAKLEELLLSKHIINQVGRKPVHVEVEQVIIALQPFGVLFGVIFNEHGRVVNSAVAKGRNGVIDAGMHTSDWVICDNGEYIEAGSGSIAKAMGTIYKRLIEAVKQTYGRKLASLHEADKALRAGHITMRGQQHPIAELAEPIIRNTAQAVLSAVLDSWEDQADGLDNVFIGGGGNSTLGPYFAERFPHAVILPDGGRTIVEGYYRYGLFKWRDLVPPAAGTPGPARKPRTKKRQLNGAKAA